MGSKYTAAAAYIAVLNHLMAVEPLIAEQILAELADQRKSLKLIASENYSSLSVQLAMGNLLTDKYSEGYPFHRFYSGCDHVDIIEQRAADLASQLFGSDHAYVQPHSGADANLVAFLAVLNQKVGLSQIEKMGKASLDQLSAEELSILRAEMQKQTLMGLSLHSGGHLTHGYRHNVSALLFRPVSYDVDPHTHRLDYAAIEQLAKQHRPLILMAGYSAYARRINFAKMREIADSVGATLIVDMAHFAGLVAGGVFTGEENPIPYAHIVTSTTHKTLRGPRGGLILCQKEYVDSINRGCPMVLGGPLQQIIAAKALAFKEALAPSFKDYAHKIVANARALAEGLMKRGLKVITDGTDNHLVLVDLSQEPITGRQAEQALREVGITANRNMVPFDPKGPWYTAGIRLGTPALTTRGLGADEMDLIAGWIHTVIKNTTPEIVEKTGKPSAARYKLDSKTSENVKHQVQELLKQFPLYPEIEM
jgi:glycine hydroxymethyltransferase